MLNFSFSELLLIVVVAVVCLGPKDLPVAVRAVAKALAQLHAFAGELRGGLQALAKEAGVEELRRDVQRDLTVNVNKITIGDDGKEYEAYDLDAFLHANPTVTLGEGNKGGQGGGE